MSAPVVDVDTSVDPGTTVPVQNVDSITTGNETTDTASTNTDATPEKVEISAEEWQKVQESQAAHKKLQDDYAKLKGVAGRQAKEIASRKEAAKVAEPEDETDIFDDEEDEPTVGKKPARMQRLEQEVAQMKAEREREADEARQRTEYEALVTAQQTAVNVAVDTGLKRLNITDEGVADLAGFVLDNLVRATAFHMQLPLESIDAAGLSEILNYVLPDFEKMLGYRAKAQDDDNATYRNRNPKVTGSPGVPTGRLPRQMNQAEKDRLFEQISRKHAGG